MAGLRFTLKVRFPEANPEPTYANCVDLNRLGSQVVLDFGWYDPVLVVRRVEELKGKGAAGTEEIELDAAQGVRIVTDFTSFFILWEKVNDLYNKVKDDPIFRAVVAAVAPVQEG